MKTTQYNLKSNINGLAITYDLAPEEPSTYDDPGCPAEAFISSVTAGGIELVDMLSMRVLDALSRKLERQHLE